VNRPRFIVASAAWLTLVATAGGSCVSSAAGASDPVDVIYPEIESLYIDLHRNPELAFHEQRTAGVLAERVKALGYDVSTGVGGTGVVAILKNGPGPVVMLRTELDALPIEEKTGLPFASTVKTKSDSGETVPVGHMCGHDLHMSAWVGTAKLMAQNREHWHGTLMLVGQPAEEIVSGATAMLKDGLFVRFPKPDYALGVHDEPTLPAGVIGFHPGYFRAAATNLDLTVFGRGAHGASPQQAIDPIVIAARIVLGLQTIVSRENNPFDPAVITVGSIHGGAVWNVIPDQVKLQLTVRSLNPDTQKRLLSAIEREARGEGQAANAPKEPVLEIRSSTDAVYNEPALTLRAASAARSALGVDHVVEMPALMGSEDYSQFGLAGVHAVLLHIGAVDPARLEASRKSGVPLPGVHSPMWAPELEPTLKAAIRAETAILTDLLQGDQRRS